MVAVSFLLRYDTLLQNVTDIVSYFITKCDKSLLQNENLYYCEMQRL